MRHSRVLLTPAQCALRALCPRLQHPPNQLPTTASTTAITRNGVVKLALPSRRHAHFVHPRSVARGQPARAKETDPFSDLIKDEQIEARYVQIVQADNSLSEPDTAWSILRTIDRETQLLVQVSPPDAETGIAVCKIHDKEELIARRRERKALDKENRKKSKISEPKQLEVNWAISANDLEHKLSQMVSFLDKGRPVEIILASKRKQRRASEDEASLVMQKIRDRLAEVDGREVKAMEGSLLKQAVLTVRKRGFD